jgi:hypothetical protein
MINQRTPELLPKGLNWSWFEDSGPTSRDIRPVPNIGKKPKYIS